MNIEFPHSPIEKTIPPHNTVDAEFLVLESDFPIEERMLLTRELWKEVNDPSISKTNFHNHLQRVLAYEDGKLQHFFLPGIPGGMGDLETFREGYDQRSEYIRSAERIFLEVCQGELWVIPKSENPYFHISLSECSALIGINEETIAIAHVSYSEMRGIQSSIDYMKSKDISPQNIYAIASVGEFQKNRSDDDFQKRAFDTHTYIAMGIPNSNIGQFEFSSRRIKESGNRILSNITHVVGCRDALFQYSFNKKIIPNPSGEFPQGEIIGEYKNEKIFVLSQQQETPS
jgi:hypothetical protein